MKTFKTIDTWIIERYKPTTVLNVLSKIEIFDVEIQGFSVKFSSYSKNKKTIINAFPNAKLISSYGRFLRFKKYFLTFPTLISLIVSLLFFSLLSSKIFKINISGDYPSFELTINEALMQHGLIKYSTFPSSNKLIEIENDILETHYDYIEFLEIRRSGVVLNIRYTKRRKGIEQPLPLNSMYATKDGIIKSIYVKKGLVEVSPNQYVKKGDLLVNDTIIDNHNKEVFIGCEGKIYAYTWYFYTLTYENINKLSKDEVFVYLLDLAKGKVGKNIDGEDEYIEKENVLQFSENASTITLKIHFTLVEDITR